MASNEIAINLQQKSFSCRRIQDPGTAGIRRYHLDSADKQSPLKLYIGYFASLIPKKHNKDLQNTNMSAPKFLDIHGLKLRWQKSKTIITFLETKVKKFPIRLKRPTGSTGLDAKGIKKIDKI